MAIPPAAADIIARLELKPHPEGGHYRETFRDIRVDADGRSRSTAIYFLLARGERSHWHRIDAVEVWHHYAGSALTPADRGRQRPAHDPARLRSRIRRISAGGRAAACLASGREPWRLDAGRLHRGARIRVCEVRAGADGLDAIFVGWVERSDTHRLHPRGEMMGIAALHPSYGPFLNTISLAAINPPPAIRTAAMAIVAVGCA